MADFSIALDPQQKVEREVAMIPQMVSVTQAVSGGLPTNAIACASQVCDFVKVINPQHSNAAGVGAAQANSVKVLINGIEADELAPGTREVYAVTGNANEVSFFNIGGTQLVYAIAVRRPHF